MTESQANILKKPGYGNRCGHQKDAPCWFFPPPSHKKRYDVIEKAKTNVARWYWKPDQWLPELRFWIRSERREGLVRFIQALLHFTCLASLQVGVNNSGQFRPIPLQRLAKYANIELKRAKRIQRDLVVAGYIQVTKRRKMLANGAYVGLAAIRTLSEKLFTDLGVSYENLKNRSQRAKVKLDKQLINFYKKVKSQKLTRQSSNKAWLDYIKTQLLGKMRAPPEGVS